MTGAGSPGSPTLGESLILAPDTLRFPVYTTLASVVPGQCISGIPHSTTGRQKLGELLGNGLRTKAAGIRTWSLDCLQYSFHFCKPQAWAGDLPVL